MNRNRRIFIWIQFLTLGFLLFLLWPSKPAFQPMANTETFQKSTPLSSLDTSETVIPSKEEIEILHKNERRKAIAKIESMLKTSITFYGKVIDQNGNLIPNVRVGYNLLDKFDASGSNNFLISDETGFFEIKGVNGAVLGVTVSKEGYYYIPDKSNQSFAYGIGPDSYNKKPPTSNDPAVFVLQKKGIATPLIFLNSRQIEVPITNKLIQIDLVTGRVGQGDLHIASQFRSEIKNRYDWSFTLSVPEGGLVEQSGPFDFEAPEEGYRNNIFVGKSASDPEWSSSAEKKYFVKLPNQKFARIKVRFYPSDYRNMIVLESYLNPIPDSRNLEYDESKRLNP